MVHAEKGTSGIWLTKTHKGGLIDAEFIAQFLQIVHAANEPGILSQNTTQALRNMVEAGIVNQDRGTALLEAAGLYQNVAQILRLCTEGRFTPETAPKDLIGLLTETTGASGLEALEARLQKSYNAVDSLFGELVV
jgi:[glutamine synthetase] adenylyltransferase / [glutamine synthetase]-adenylyl-L-tyrosine phosphorylase